MEEIITKNNLDTYTAGLKNKLNSLGAAINSSSLESKIDIIDQNIDTIMLNYVTKTDLQNALANIGGGEVVTIHTTNASGNAHVECKSGDTVIAANLADGDTVTIPFGVEYNIIGYDDNELATKKITAVAAKMSSSYSFDLAVTGIDLGLPSGNIWAINNVGASTPYQAGLYFSWGNTTGYASGYDFSSSNYSSSTDDALTASFDSGDPKYDAAAAIMGGDWRMPTKTEFEELINNCTWTWDSTNKGYTVTGSNSKSIFIPASGYYSGTTFYSSGAGGRYWSTTCNDSSSAYYLSFSSSSCGMSDSGRYYGRSIRAVRTPQS